jgi:hypothetical protein
VITSLLLLLLVTRGERGRTTTEQLLFVYFSTIYFDQPVYSCVRLFSTFHSSPSHHLALRAGFTSNIFIKKKITRLFCLQRNLNLQGWNFHPLRLPQSRTNTCRWSSCFSLKKKRRRSKKWSECFDIAYIYISKTLRWRFRILVYRVQRTMYGHNWTTSKRMFMALGV